MSPTRKDSNPTMNVGDEVQDPISGLAGIVVARTQYLYGCVRLSVQPHGSKDGKPFETFGMDEPHAVLVSRRQIDKTEVGG